SVLAWWRWAETRQGSRSTAPDSGRPISTGRPENLPQRPGQTRGRGNSPGLNTYPPGERTPRPADRSKHLNGDRHDGARQRRVLCREGFSIREQRGSGKGRWKVRLGN